MKTVSKTDKLKFKKVVVTNNESDEGTRETHTLQNNNKYAKMGHFIEVSFVTDDQTGPMFT